MAENLVIVESPAKAKTIKKYLGKDFEVLASYGHVRDLIPKEGAVDPEHDFRMQYRVIERNEKHVEAIARSLKKANALYLATDPDREGEAISWHLHELLKERGELKGKKVHRVAFYEITKNAIQAAVKEPRDLSMDLVNAQQARRALDYLVGFNLSPLLWKKVRQGLSAGRVQSPALRMICERDEAIDAFKPQEYWTIEAQGEHSEVTFPLKLVEYAGKKVEQFSFTNEGSAREVEATLNKAADGKLTVDTIDRKQRKRNPAPPFTTSTLQQEAARKLGFSASHTMRVAQRLYEGVDIGGETVGLITYMRTDGVQMAPEAIEQIRREIRDQYGPRYAPGQPREYRTKAKNAQEAHEAIRPTDVRRRPNEIRKHLAEDEAKLYALVWQRAVASQMSSAELEQTTADIEAKGRDGRAYTLRATGSVVLFDGFLKLYEEGRDDRVRVVDKGKEDHSDDEDSARLPALATGDKVADRKIEPEQHFTQPPPRYSEATLVKRMEELGIGRPSTYASTLAVLQERDYVRTEKKRLIPEDKGRLVTAFLESFFKRYVEFDFTADLEEKLDLISDGKLEWKDVLREFWRDFTAAVGEIKDLRVSEVLEALNDMLGPHIFPARAEGGDPRQCPNCGEGRLSLKISGKFGAFIGCSRYPDCRYTRQLSQSGDGPAEASTPDGKLLGHDPETGLAVTLRTGRFGPYVQLGEGSKEEKPKRSSVPKGVDPNAVDLERALQLLSLPRQVGMHPETNTPVVANLGRFGPFILHDGTYVNLPAAEEVFTIGLNHAVVLLAEKRAGGGKGRFQRAAPTVLNELGEHPSLGGKVQVLSGRYGPYVKHGDVNATLPKAKDPAKLTMDEAVALIEERAAKGPSKGKAKRASKPKAEAAEGEAKPKKAAAKKSAPKSKKATKDAA